MKEVKIHIADILYDALLVLSIENHLPVDDVARMIIEGSPRIEKIFEQFKAEEKAGNVLAVPSRRLREQ